MTTVVDASVVLAWLQDEPGADEAEPLLMDGVIGAANWSEVLRKVRQHGAPAGVVARLLASFGLTVVDVTRADAEIAAGLWTRGTSFSLADRLCLALGLRADLPVATADAAWMGLDRAPELILIR
jgi:PIN domain nuclease of toxin-antitoxin system